VTCRLYEKQLSLYLDGELPAARAARLEAHLRLCPHCRGELKAMIGIADHIRAASTGLEVSHDFDQRVLRAVGYWEVTGRRVARPRSLLRPLFFVAVVLLALLGIIWHYLAPPPSRQPQPAAAQIAPAPAVPGTPVTPPGRRQR